MKITTLPIIGALRPSFMAIVFVFFAGLLVLSCKNHQTSPLFTTFSMPEHELITSLDSLNKDTLLAGTDQGNLYFYCPKTDDGPVDTLRVGNHRPVYFAYTSDLGLFVGVSNEGLKLFSSYGKSDRKPKHQYLLQLNGDTCTSEYAVYKVLKFGDTLFCATSNGLAWLKLSNLKDTILKSLYPNRKLPDCKIERLYLEGDSLKVYYNDSILSFNISGKFNTQHTSRPIPSDSREEMVSIKNITYKFKQYDTKFYAYDTLTINPHNFVFVTSMMNNDKIIAIADDDGITKDVYVGKKGGKLRWNRTWTKCLRNVPGQITDFIFFPNKSCLILTSEEVAYKGDKRGVQRLEFPSDTTSEEIEYELVKPGVLRRKDSLKPKDQPNRVKSVYYSENFKKLYVALGAGYAYYNLISEDPIWDSCRFVDYKDSAEKSYAFRCFAEWKQENEKEIWFGTIDDGILRMDKDENRLDLLYYKDVRYFLNPFTNLKDFYVLTGDSIYYKRGGEKEVIGGKNAYVRRLHYAKNDGVFGISSGRLYKFDFDSVANMVRVELAPTFGKVNQYAILDNCDYIYVGTDKGLFYTKDGNLDNFKVVDVFDPFLKTRIVDPLLKSHVLWPFILVGITALILILGFVLYRFMKRRHEELLGKKKDENKDLNDQLEKIAKATIGLQEQLKMSPKENEGIEDKLKKVSNEITALNGQLGKKDDDIVLEGQLEKVAKATTGLQEQLKLNPEENEGLEEQLEKVAKATTGLQEQLGENPKENESPEEKLENVANAIGQLKEQLGNKENDITDLNDQLEKVAKATKGLQEQLKLNPEENEGLEDQLKKVSNAITELKGQLEKVADAKKDLEKQLILDRYQKLYSSDLPEDEESRKSKDWVIRTASQYKDRYRDLVVEVEKSTFTKDNSIEKMRESVNRSMLEYAFAAELYNLRIELHKKDLNKQEDVKNVFAEIKDLSDRYLEKIVKYDDSKKHRTKKDVLLHFWVIALLSEGEKTKEDINYIHNDEFLKKFISLTQYGKQPRSKGRKPASPTSLRNIIGEDITTVDGLFQSKLEDDSLFKDIVAALKEENRIKEYKPKSTENKEELESLKEKLKSYAATMPKKEFWDNIIDMIKLLHGNQKEEKGFVFDGSTVHKEKLPSEKLLNEGVRLDITNSNLSVSDFEDPLKKLFNKVTYNSIKEDIDALISVIGRDGKDVLKDELSYKQIKRLCSSIKLMFKPVSGEKVHDWEGALLLLTWGLVVNDQCRNKDFLQEFLQKMQNKSNEGGNMDETELERWLKILNRYDNPSSIIKPKEQFAELFKKKEEDWKNARLSVLNLFGINQQW